MDYKNIYYDKYVELYNQSVKHDNEKGVNLDVVYANQIAKDYAEKNLSEEEQAKFLDGWRDFFYHIFD